MEERTIEQMFDGIKRLTFPMPMRPGHVHTYLLPAADGSILVDTGLGLPDLAERWQALLPEIGPVSAIVVTHMHPDHVGGAADVAAATGAPVYQGALDYAECERVWGSVDWPQRIAAWFELNGVPEDLTRELVEAGGRYRSLIRYAHGPRLLHEGDELEGWRILWLPGHADGHICLFKEGVLVAGDHVLQRITPAVGLYPESRPDPLGDYLGSLARVVELAPRVALPGHGEPLADPAGRAREIVEHHRIRLDEAQAALTDEPQTGYELSLALFGVELGPGSRRFAVAETLSHLERLVASGRAARAGDGGPVTYTGA